MERAEAVVVGLGAMGSATAHALGRRGVGVVALERFRLGHARGSSHGPTRIFRLSYPDAGYVRMAVRALDLWRALEVEAGEELLVSTGGIDVGPMATLCAEALTECGVAHEWLTPEDGAHRFPGIAIDEPALIHPAAGVCLADRTVTALARLAAASGVDVREEVEVTAVRTSEDRVLVETSAGEIEADVAVVTPGAWAAHILPDAPVFAAAQTVTYFRPVEAGAAWPTFIEWEEDGFAWYEVPEAGGASGIKVAEHRPARPVDPADGPFEPDAEAIGAAIDHVRRRFPGLDPEPVASETCLYELTPDEDFVLDRTGPVVVGTGGSGHAFKFTPLLGEILADLTQQRDPDFPLARFSLRRFDR